MAKTAKQRITPEAYETALQTYVQNNNVYAQLAAKRDARVLAIDEEYNERFKDLKTSMDEAFDIVQGYCDENHEVLFTEKKSLEAFGAKVGYREGKEKVVLIKGFKLKDVVAKMMKVAKWRSYIRETPELDKVALLSAKPNGMEAIGLEIVQEESFYIEVDQTETPNA